MTYTYRAARSLFTCVITASLLATVVSIASARNLSVSSQTIRATWTRLGLSSELVTIGCLVTIEGSFHSRTIAKVVNSLIGAITRVNFKEETCTNGRFRPKNAPWHIQYGGFTGSLPNITAVQLKLGRFRFEIIVAGLCTADYGAAEDLMTFNANLTAGAITSLVPVEGSNVFRRVSGTGLCPPSGRLAASAAENTVTALGSTARVTVTLI